MRKILVIHDKVDQAFEPQSDLEERGYSVYITTGTSDGLKIAERYLPDIIICELDDFDNELSIVKSINSNPNTECIPLILITKISNQIHFRTAMDLGADDVILKPFNADSLLKSIQKRLRKIEVIKSKLTETIISTDNAFANHKKVLDHILVKIGNKLKLIEFSKIVCITALKEYSKITTEDGCKIIVRKSIRNWVETLPAKDFLRIHRATIVNMTFLDKIEKAGFRSYNVYLKTHPEPFPISQRYGNIMRKTFSI